MHTQTHNATVGTKMSISKFSSLILRVCCMAVVIEVSASLRVNKQTRANEKLYSEINYIAGRSEHFKTIYLPRLDKVTRNGFDPINFTGQLFKDVFRQVPNLENKKQFEFIRDPYPLPGGLSKPYDEYDFVIVGAGPTGCVLANRLSEGGKWTVLLLEAGGAESILTDIPLVSGLLSNTDYYWPYTMEKQEGACLGVLNETCSTSAGKGLGGGTLVNYMVYARGGRQYFDNIAKAGNKGWSYDEVLPYFLKSEKANLDGLEDTPYHGKDGLLNIEQSLFWTEYGRAFLESMRELGQKVQDVNNEEGMGFGRVQLISQKGRRQSAAKAFLYPFRHRKNMHILPRSRVTRLKINKNTKRVDYVEYARNRIRYKVKARKEVILSAGPHSSPKILMLSGIGPKDHLEANNIEVVKDLKVGETFYDHYAFGGLFFIVDEPNRNNQTSGMEIFSSIFQYIANGTGFVSTVFGGEALGFIDVSKNRSEKNVVELAFGNVPIGSNARLGQAILQFGEDLYEEYIVPLAEKRTVSVVPILVNTKSKGYVRLKDNNPFHWLKVYGNSLSDERDMDALLSSIRFVQRMENTKAFKKFNAKLYKQPIPACKSLEYDSDDYWRCGIRWLGINFRHPVATCKMGPDTDLMAVVDEELRVRGIKGLRVADSSILPLPVLGHPVASCFMVGEKAADYIKDAWRNNS